MKKWIGVLILVIVAGGAGMAYALDAGNAVGPQVASGPAKDQTLPPPSTEDLKKLGDQLAEEKKKNQEMGKTIADQSAREQELKDKLLKESAAQTTATAEQSKLQYKIATLAKAKEALEAQQKALPSVDLAPAIAEVKKQLDELQKKLDHVPVPNTTSSSAIAAGSSQPGSVTVTVNPVIINDNKNDNKSTATAKVQKTTVVNKSGCGGCGTARKPLRHHHHTASTPPAPPCCDDVAPSPAPCGTMCANPEPTPRCNRCGNGPVSNNRVCTFFGMPSKPDYMSERAIRKINPHTGDCAWWDPDGNRPHAEMRPPQPLRGPTPEGRGGYKPDYRYAGYQS